MAGKLTLVATPIGNLGDISARCAGALEEADFVAAEDTRVTVKLLNHLGLKKPMVSYFEHNKTESGERIVCRILAGENCALVTDAGTPAISDPGEDLVKKCAGAGIEVVCIPGPCAAVCALAASGLPTGRFTFEGFLSVNKKSRNEHLKALAGEKRTMVFYEAPHKLQTTLADLLSHLGDRKISLSREMTKIHEETLRMTLSEAAAYFETVKPRGEFVIVVEGSTAPEKASVSIEQALHIAEEYMQKGMTLKDAVKCTAADTGLSKNALYSASLKKI